MYNPTLFLNLGTRWGWVVNATPRPLYPWERPPTHCVGGWMGPRAGLDGCGKSRPHRDSSPGPSSRGQKIFKITSVYHGMYSNDAFALTHLDISGLSLKRDRQCICNITLRRVRAIIIAVEKQYYIFWVCVCSFRHRAFNAHVPYLCTVRL